MKQVHSLVNRSLKRAAYAALVSAGILAGSQSAMANTENDVINGQTDLTLAGTYAGGLPTSTSDVTFTNTAYSPAAFTLGSGLQVGTLNDLSPTSLSISGAGPLTLSGGTNAVSINAADELYVASGGTLTIVNTPISISTAIGSGLFDIVGNANLGGAISGSGAITKIGNGTLLLSGANTYTGNTSISNGTLKLGSSSVGTAATVGNNGTLSASAIGTGYLFIGGGGFIGFDLNGQTFGNRFVISNNNDTIKNTSASAATISGVMDGSINNNVISSFNVGNDNGGDINWTGQISRTNGSLGITKTGNDTVTFSGTANTGVGTVVVTSGTLGLGKSGSNGAFADTVTISGGTLKFRPDLGTASGGGVWGGQLNGTLSIGGGTIDLFGSTGQNSRVQQFFGTGGTVTNSSATAGVLGISARNNSAYSFTGTVQDGAGTVGIDLSNQGTTGSGGRINEFSGANTYSGGTSISYGTFELGNALAAQNSVITVNNESGTGTNGAYAGITTTGSPLGFANGIGTFTIGGLSGTGGFKLTDLGYTSAFVAGTAATVSLQIGSNLAANATPAVYGGVISDGSVAGGSVVKIGSSTETFSNYNTYTGGTTVNGGTLVLSATGGSLGTIRGVLTINTGGTVKTTVADTIGYGTPGTQAISAININGGTFDNGVNGNNGYVTDFYLTGGNVTSSGGGAINFATSNLYSVASTAISTFSAPISLRSNSLTITAAAGTVSGGVDLNISGAISNGFNGSNLNKAGAGVVVLGGANTYTGTTNILAGVLQAGVASVAGTSGAFGNGTAVVISTVSGAGLALNGFNTQVGSIAGFGSISLGSGTLTTGQDNSSPTYAGVISGSGGLVKIGTGTQGLNNVNTYTGATSVSNGSLKMSGSNNVIAASSSVGIASGASVDVNGNTQFVLNNLTGAGSVTSGFSQIGSGLALVNSVDSTFSGTINGNIQAGITKSGVGNLTFTGANNYVGTNGSHLGTNIVAGTLTATVDGGLGNLSSANNYVSIGASGALVVGSGAAISTGFIGDLDTLTIATGGTDTLNYTGTDSVAALVLGGIAQSATGTYGSSASGATYQSSFFNGSGTITVVPEPTSIGLLGLAAGGLLARRRRRAM